MDTLKQILTHENFPSIYHDTIYAIVLLIAFFLLREPITNLLGRISSNKNPVTGETNFRPVSAPGSKSRFKGETEGAEPTGRENKRISPTTSSSPSSSTDDEYKIAHHFWLGSDLMEAVSSVAYVPNKEKTLQALRQCQRHFKKSGFSSEEIENRLSWIIDLCEKKVVSEWGTDQNRKDLLNEILVIRQKIAQFVEQRAGSEFDPWND